MNPYKVLGLKSTATDEQIKSAFREKAKSTHPDKNPGKTTVAKEFNDVVQAYNILTDPVRRAEYDRILKNQKQNGKMKETYTTSTRPNNSFSPEEVYELIRIMRAEYNGLIN